MYKLENLVGLKVNEVKQLDDYIQISFSDGAIFSVYNTYVYDGESIFELESKAVKSVSDNDLKVSIAFHGGGSIHIGLEANSYNGPEAITLKPEGAPMIVWN
jgi:hypothetical protein